jgi:tRNA uridine 5-carboxymethylaminomethyl modification enzyme
LVTDIHWQKFCEKREAIELERQRIKSTWVQPDSEQAKQIQPLLANKISREYSLYDLLKRPEVTHKDISALTPELEIDAKVSEQVEVDAKYAGYISRQQDEIDRLRRHENTVIPQAFDYSRVSGLSNEIKQKLGEAKPETLARASRIPGVTPAAISLLLITLKKNAA